MALVLLVCVALVAGLYLGQRWARRPPSAVQPDPVPPVRVLDPPAIADRLAADPKYRQYDEPTRRQIAASIHRAAQRRIPGAKPRGGVR